MPICKWCAKGKHKKCDDCPCQHKPKGSWNARPTDK